MTTATEQEPRAESPYEQHVRKWMSDRREKRCFTAQAAGAELEIAILDVIGEDFWTGEGVTSKWVKKLLDSNPDVTSIRVLLDSPGGSVFDGVAIHNLLKRSSANVVVEVLGEASSAASVIAMAGNTIKMHEGSTMMIHRASCMAYGFADDFRSAADALDTISGSITDIYETRSGRARADVEAMVRKETWMSASDAVKQGFADEVVNAGAKPAPPKKSNGSAAPAMAQAAEFELKIDTSKLEDVADDIRASVAKLAKLAPQAIASNEAQKTPIAEPTAPTGAATTTTALQARQEKEDDTMSEMFTTIRALLALGAGTPETDVIAAVGRLRDLEREVVTLTGAKSTEECVGGVRALKAKADEADVLKPEIEKIRAERDKQNFETLVANGQANPVKLSPAVAKMYRDEFNAAVAQGKGADVVERLRGFLAVAPVIIAEAPRQVRSSSKDGDASSLVWSGKTYQALSYSERARLKNEQPDLWKMMKDEWEAKGSPEQTASAS